MFSQAFAQTTKRRIAAELFKNCVASDRKAGTGNVFLAQVWERLLKFFPPLWIAL